MPDEKFLFSKHSTIIMLLDEKFCNVKILYYQLLLPTTTGQLLINNNAVIFFSNIYLHLVWSWLVSLFKVQCEWPHQYCSIFFEVCIIPGRSLPTGLFSYVLFISFHVLLNQQLIKILLGEIFCKENGILANRSAFIFSIRHSCR